MKRPGSLILLLACIACGGASKSAGAAAPEASRSYADSDVTTEAAPGMPAEAAPGPVAAGGDAGKGRPPQPMPQQQRQAGPSGQPLSPARKPLLIYTATLTLAVFEARKNIDAVQQLALERGGYLVRRTDSFIMVRVPAEKFAETLEQVARLGDVILQDVSAQDVTAEFRDLEIRIRNLEAVRERMAKLLDQAKNVQEAIVVEHELERVTAQIEEIKGRLKLLSELIAYSTINVTFQARPIEPISSQVKLPFRWLEKLGLPRLLSL